MDWKDEFGMINERFPNNRLVTPNSNWLMRAIEEKNDHLMVGLACSELWVFDKLDRRLLTEPINKGKN